jgi:amidase
MDSGRLPTPSIDELAGHARRHHLPCSPADLDRLRRRLVAAFPIFDDLVTYEVQSRDATALDRDPGRAPTPSEDPINALVRVCTVAGAASGPLHGWRIGVKDNIAVAGLPMLEGDPRLETTPGEDALVVKRLLAAGGTITAKTRIRTSDEPAALTRNPLNPRYAAEGSSSGSAAAVAAGMVDVALGSDTGGSIRGPAAGCGLVGIKPTYGLVPTRGLAAWDPTMDTIGPITRTVRDNATVLSVIAGSRDIDADTMDHAPARESYTAALDEGIAGLRVGVVGEVAHTVSPSAAHACERLRRAGAIVADTSIPLWPRSGQIWLATLTYNMCALADTHGHSYGHVTRVDIERASALIRQYRAGHRQVPWLGDTLPVLFDFLRDHAEHPYFEIAQNLRLELRRQVNAALAEVDVLIAPIQTSPLLVSAASAEPSEVNLARLADAMRYTAAASLTGHPAISVPAGRDANGLGMGVQIIGRHFGEAALYRVALAIESSRSGGSQIVAPRQVER